MTDSGTLISGWAYKLKSKKPTLGSAWNKRWFSVQILSGGSGKELVLAYATAKGAYDPNGWIFLREIHHIIYSNEATTLLPSGLIDTSTFGFSQIRSERCGFILAAESRNFLLKCDTETQVKMWVEGLRRLCGLSHGNAWPSSVGVPPKPVPYLVQLSMEKKLYLKYESPLPATAPAVESSSTPAKRIAASASESKTSSSTSAAAGTPPSSTRRHESVAAASGGGASVTIAAAAAERDRDSVGERKERESSKVSTKPTNTTRGSASGGGIEEKLDESSSSSSTSGASTGRMMVAASTTTSKKSSKPDPAVAVSAGRLLSGTSSTPAVEEIETLVIDEEDMTVATAEGKSSGDISDRNKAKSKALAYEDEDDFAAPAPKLNAIERAMMNRSAAASAVTTESERGGTSYAIPAPSSVPPAHARRADPRSMSAEKRAVTTPSVAVSSTGGTDSPSSVGGGGRAGLAGAKNPTKEEVRHMIAENWDSDEDDVDADVDDATEGEGKASAGGGAGGGRGKPGLSAAGVTMDSGFAKDDWDEGDGVREGAAREGTSGGRSSGGGESKNSGTAGSAAMKGAGVSMDKNWLEEKWDSDEDA